MTLDSPPLTQPPIRENRVPILNHYLAFRQNPLQFWMETGEQGPVQRIRLGPHRLFWVITDADLFQQILQKKAKLYPRDRQIRRRDGINKHPSVFNAPTYEEWLWRRRLLQPGFHMRQIQKFADIMVDETIELAERYRPGERFDLVSLMKSGTMRIICKTMFNASIEETDILQESFEQTSEFSYHNLTAIIKLPEWVPTRLNQKTRHAVQVKADIIRRMVQSRFEADPLGEESIGDMLDMLISAQLEEDGHRFSEEDLIGEMNSLIFAGHETTALTLAWVFYLLSQHPAVRAKVMQEVDQLGRGKPTLESIRNMPYTEAVILETLRMYPPVYATLREAEEDDNLNGYPIPAGTQIILNIRGLHRDPRYWSDPNRFNPERFLNDAHVNRHKFAFMPFIGGPKKCIGDSFAMMEMQLVVPTLLQRVRFEYVGNRPVVEKAKFVMETEEPVWMTATPI